MSVEGPEARIVADQMAVEVVGRRVTGVVLRDVARLQSLEFVNRDRTDFDRMRNGTIEDATSRGNSILLTLDNGVNLFVAPEYGGRVLIHDAGDPPPAKTHLVVDLDDGRRLSVRLTGMGVLRCDSDEQLRGGYVYRRDFSDTPDPTREPVPYGRFEQDLTGRRQALKAVLVGRDAIIVGISNSAFQDILYRARVHPAARASDLSAQARQHLHVALHEVVRDRLRLGGKTSFIDLYGVPGRYHPAMGPERRDTLCDTCGRAIASLNLSGSRVFYCPGCQR